MLEYLFCLLLTIIAAFYIYTSPILRQWQSFTRESTELQRRYNRLHKARQDMLMHFDWAIARADPVKTIEGIGREIERMDRELATIHEDLTILNRTRWSMNAVIPMKNVTK